MIATESSLDTPARISARARALERASSSPNVTSPSSSINAVSSGLRAAADAIPAAGEAPQRRTAWPTARSSPGLIGRMIPASARTLRLNGRSMRLPSCPTFTCLTAPPIVPVMLFIAPATASQPIAYRVPSPCEGSKEATAIAAIPSSRPIAPRPSLVVALTATGAPTASDSRDSIASR